MRLIHHQLQRPLILQPHGDWHHRSLMYLPRWRYPLVGYPVGLLLVALSLAIGLIERVCSFLSRFQGSCFCLSSFWWLSAGG